MSGQSELTLSELERDALTELVNIGVSRAAASLRSMVGRQVLLSVPSIEIVTHGDAASLLRERESDELVAVRQDFAGPFQGRALLIFPQANSCELVRAVMGEDVPADDGAEMERETLAETGNIILNGCLGTMANMLRQSLRMSLPEVMRGRGATLFQLETTHVAAEGFTETGTLVLFLYINFSVLDRDIRGYIAMLMDLPSMTALKLLVKDFIEAVIGDDPVIVA